jgi:hypothetical protein
MMVTAVVPALIGAVGPACSDAATSAARTFLYTNYTLVSFAAMSELLSSRGIFPNFFRSVSTQFRTCPKVRGKRMFLR